jgi:thymidylate synthase ThyX
MSALGVHKQLANRLLEPFSWHTVVVTATEWENFWALRCSPMAQPEIRTVAEMMRELYRASEPAPMNAGDWHTPFVDGAEKIDLVRTGNDMRKVSAGRCARVSYLTHEGRRDPSADVALYDRLVVDGHMSPLEHVATPIVVDSGQRWSGNFFGWFQYRKQIPGESVFAPSKV